MARQTPANKAAATEPELKQEALLELEETTEEVTPAMPEVYTLVDPAGNEYKTPSKAEAMNRVRSQGYTLLVEQ